MFKRLFYSEFNIGFSSPASDVCGTCLNLKNAIKKDNEDRLKTELKPKLRGRANYRRDVGVAKPERRISSRFAVAVQRSVAKSQRM
nr:unnamed protein product [Callosobruchus chinensis]